MKYFSKNENETRMSDEMKSEVTFICLCDVKIFTFVKETCQRAAERRKTPPL